MKKALFCLQNEFIEKILAERGLVDKDSYILRSKEEVTLSIIDKINPDLIFFPHWSFRVPEEVIQKYSCICFHSTPLPYGRGGSPIQNMISRGHLKTEVCALLMVEAFDAGPIFLRNEISLEGKLSDILNRVYNTIANQISLLLEENIEPIEQVGEPTLFKRLTGKDNLIPETSDLSKVFDKIRMLDSDLYPSSYINYNSLTLEFSDANFFDDRVEAKVIFRNKK